MIKFSGITTLKPPQYNRRTHYWTSKLKDPSKLKEINHVTHPWTCDIIDFPKFWTIPSFEDVTPPNCLQVPYTWKIGSLPFFSEFTGLSSTVPHTAQRKGYCRIRYTTNFYCRGLISQTFLTNINHNLLKKEVFRISQFVLENYCICTNWFPPEWKAIHRYLSLIRGSENLT